MQSRFPITFITLILGIMGGCKQEIPAPLIEISFLAPEEGSFFFPDEPIKILAETTSSWGFSHWEVFFDDALVRETDEEILDGMWDHKFSSEGSHRIRIRAFDINNQSVEEEITLLIVQAGEDASFRESFENSIEERWFLSNWAKSASTGWDDNNSLRSSRAKAYAITRKQFHEPGSIGFYVKNGSGQLEFHLDGKVKAKWFGKEGWGYYSYAVPKGEHVFKWISNAEDTYIDRVEFTGGVERHTPGEFFGGGIVFYLDSTGLHGLIAAPRDGDYGGNMAIPWGCYDLPITSGNMAQSATDGKANTKAIVADCKEHHSAARYCDDLSVTEDTMVFDDWYLPALVELDHLHTHRHVIDNLYGKYYWSSTTRAAHIAAVINFLDGSHHSAHRSIPNVMGPVTIRILVRPIRDF